MHYGGEKMPEKLPISKKDESVALPICGLKPLLRGWLHALATLAAIIFIVFLCLRSRTDVPRLLSLLIYGLSMIELYGVSAIYHIGNWSLRTCFLLRTLDHANIFLFIAGTYTPLCFNLLVFLAATSVAHAHLVNGCSWDEPDGPD